MWEVFIYQHCFHASDSFVQTIIQPVYRLTRVVPDKFYRAVKRLCLLYIIVMQISELVKGESSGECLIQCCPFAVVELPELDNFLQNLLENRSRLMSS